MNRRREQGLGTLEANETCTAPVRGVTRMVLRDAGRVMAVIWGHLRSMRQTVQHGAVGIGKESEGNGLGCLL